MQDRIRELHAACLPFVTRALRGSTRRRVTLGSLLLLVSVVLMGAFIGRASSFAAHDLRVSLGLESSRWDREQREFTIFADDERERAELLQELDRGQGEPERWSQPGQRAQEAWVLLDMVADQDVIPPRQYQGLQRQARALRDATKSFTPDDLEVRRNYAHFNWNDPDDRARLQAVIDAELRPRVVLYTSPLDTATTIRLIGALASGVLLLLLTVIAPLWVGVQLAQELHENTLQPLTGTALTPKQLVLGLVAGPLSPVAIVAAPMLALVLIAAAVAGRMVPALAMVLMGAAMGAMLVGLAMLAAAAVGRQRAPGIVGIGLLGLLGAAGLAGTTAGLELNAELLGLVTVLPEAGPIHLAGEAFFPQSHLSGARALALDLRLVLATLGAVVLATLCLRALERRIGGTHREGALRPGEAGVAALMLAALAVAAIPSQADFGGTFLAAAALAVVPLQLVLMGRVPGGDTPPRLRRVPIARLLAEHAIWLGMVLVVTLLVAGPPDHIRPRAILGVMHLGWATAVVALVTLRATALPASIPTKLWLMVCLGFVLIEFVAGAIWCMDRPGIEMLFPMGAAHPLLGLLHIGMFVWIPVSLVRGLLPAEPAQ